MVLRFERLEDLAVFFVDDVFNFIVRPNGYELRLRNGSVRFIDVSHFRLMCGHYEDL